MPWTDIVAGSVTTLAGAGAVFLGGARHRRARRDASREERDYSNRREACLFLERQRAHQLALASQLYYHHRVGTPWEEKDTAGIESADIDATLSLFLPDVVERELETVNERFETLRSSHFAVGYAADGQPRTQATEKFYAAFEELKVASESLRKLLKEEARPR